MDLFVRNGLHAESRALVLAESGYPDYLLPRARELLRERPDLPTFLLHDSTASGMGMRARIDQGRLLPVAGHPIVDLGITPEDVGKLKRLACVEPKRQGNRVAVDLLPFAMLATGLGLASGTSLAAPPSPAASTRARSPST